MARSIGRRALILLAVLGLLATTAAAPVGAADAPRVAKPTPVFSGAAAFDVSPSLAALKTTRTPAANQPDAMVDLRPDRGPVPADAGFAGDGALVGPSARAMGPGSAMAPGSALAVGEPVANFEGISNLDNFNLFGFRVNPPDPVGDVGPNHYVEMVNLAFAVYDKTGNLLLGPVDTGTLWAGFPIEDCTDPSGDPIVCTTRRPTTGS
jgi:hypothetical protein